MYIYVQGWNALSEVHEKVTGKRDINDTDIDREEEQILAGYALSIKIGACGISAAWIV